MFYVTCRMSENTMSSVLGRLISAYHSGDAQMMKDVLEFVEVHVSGEMIEEFVRYAANCECPIVERELVLTLLKKWASELNDEQVVRLLRCLGEADGVFVGLLAATLGPVVNERTLQALLEVPYTFGVAATCIHVRVSVPPPNMLEFLMRGFGATDNRWTPVVCARALGNFEPESLGVLKAFVYDRFAAALTDDVLAVQCELLRLVEKLDECPEKFALCFGKLKELAQMVPFGEPEIAPDGTRYRKTELAVSLLRMVESIVDQGYSEYNPMELALILVSLCVASDEELRRWQCDIECFVTDNFVDQTSQSLRTECVGFFLSESLGSVEIDPLTSMLVEFGARGGRFQEAVYFVMAYCKWFPGSVPEPTTDDPLTMARFVECLVLNGKTVEPSLFSGMLDSGKPMFQIMAARSLSFANDASACPDILLKAMQALTGLFPQFETSVIVEVVDIFHELGIALCKIAPEHVLAIVRELLKQWTRFACDKDAAKMISSNISVYVKDPRVFAALSEVVLGQAAQFMASPNTTGAAYDLAYGLLCQLPKEGCVLSERCRAGVYDAFVRSIQKPWDALDLSVICGVSAALVRMNMVEPFDTFFVQLLRSSQQELCSVMFSEVAIALIMKGSTQSGSVLTSLMQLLISLQCPDVSTESQIKLKICTVFAYIYSRNKDLIIGINAPWIDIVGWMADNIIQVSCAKFDVFLWFNMCLTFPHVTSQHLSVVYRNMAKYVNMSGMFPGEFITFQFSQVNPDIIDHPFSSLSVREFFCELLSGRSDVPSEVAKLLLPNM